MSNAAVDELLHEINYLIGCFSLPSTQQTISQVLQDHGCQFEQSVVFLFFLLVHSVRQTLLKKQLEIKVNFPVL